MAPQVEYFFVGQVAKLDFVDVIRLVQYADVAPDLLERFLTDETPDSRRKVLFLVVVELLLLLVDFQYFFLCLHAL